MIKRLLIANRGEIACRIIHTARRLGVATIAIYSVPDADAQHVLQADTACALGGHTAAESYLNQDKIIQIAKEQQADAIHPGYGFLAEDAGFAEKVIAAGLIFVGPSAANIELMGDKERAKTCATEANLPIAKDFRGDVNDKEQLLTAANDIGYPLLVKASAGGGGKGMRLVQREEDLLESVDAAAREAQASFGNAAVFLEQYIRPARHIEVQIACDQYGNGVHLYTRECSIQRRHQKVIEEAPAYIPESVERAMCDASLQLAKHIGYLGLGTLEFLLDENHQFYFMEMNTRLQVEHPVTEMVTGLDCVTLQLAIASGEPLPMQQSEISCRGHSIEARICAETPLNDFMPSSGKLAVLTVPENCRFDTGVVAGDTISPFYDSMIAKVISYGEDRIQASYELAQALACTHIVGPDTNVEFIAAILNQPAYRAGNISTEFISIHYEQIKQQLNTLSEYEKSCCLNAYSGYDSHPILGYSNNPNSPWLSINTWRANGIKSPELRITINGESYPLPPLHKPPTTGYYTVYNIDQELHVFVNSKHLVVNKRSLSTATQDAMGNENNLSSKVPGTVTKINVAVGDTVEVGQTILCVEAMKMEHAIKANKAAKIAAIHVTVGQTISEGEVLVEL